MRRISQQEWENEHMHDPMTEGEALAVDVERYGKAWPIIGKLYLVKIGGVLQHEVYMFDQGDCEPGGSAPPFWSRDGLDDCPEFDPRKDQWIALDAIDAAIAAHTAAQQPVQAVAWQRSIEIRPGYWGEWAEYTDLYDEGRPEKVGRFNCRYRPLYTAPPSAPVGVDLWANVPKEYAGLWSYDYDESRLAYMVLASNRSSIAETEDPEVADAICRAHNCALTQQPAQAAPGWKLVPVEPTIPMIEAFAAVQTERGRKLKAREALSAMLAAAPTPPGDDAAGERRDDLDDQDDMDLEAYLGSRS